MFESLKQHKHLWINCRRINCSRALNQHEQNLSSNEQELLCIISAINHFRQFLLGHTFKVFTDNTGCLANLKKPDLAPKLQRWALMVGDMSFTLHHVKGKLNHVDSLSRIEHVVVLPTRG